MSNKFSRYFIFVFLMLMSLQAQAQNPGNIPFQALITNTSDVALTNTTFTGGTALVIEILDDANSCVIYKEVVNTVSTDGKGMLSWPIGTGALTFAPGAPVTIQSILSSPTFGVTSCLPGTAASGTALSVNQGDIRAIQFSVDNGTTWSTATVVSIGSVPYAFNADSLGGVAAGSYLQSTSGNGQTLTAGAASDASALHNHDSHNDLRYAQIGGSGGQGFNASTVTATNETLTGTLGVGTATPSAALDIEKGTSDALIIGTTTSSGNTMSLLFDSSGGTNRASISSADNSNTLTFTTGGATAMTISPAQVVTFNSTISAGGAIGTAAYLSLGKYATGSEPVLTPAQEGSIWENNSNHVLRFWDGTTNQNLVESVTAGNGLSTVGQVWAQTLSVAYGTTANTALQGNQTFLGDITGTSQTTNVAKLQGYTLNLTVPPTNNQVLTYSTGTSTWTAQNAGGTANTLGSVIFGAGGTTLTQDNTKFFWDDTNFRLGINAGAAPGNRLSVNAPTTADATAQELVTNTAVTNKALVLQEMAGQTAHMMEVQNSAGTALYSIESTGTPTANTDLVNKNYVNTLMGNYLSATGTTPLSGTWNAGNQIIDGVLKFSVGTAVANNPITVNNATTADPLAQELISTNASTNKGLVVQELAGQTANLVETQSPTGAVLSVIDAAGKLGLVNLAADPGSFTGADIGKVWYNSASNQIKYYNGTIQVVGTAGAGITSLNGLTAAAQTFVNGANVTITSAGSTHTLGWAGQLSVANGGTGASLAPATGGIVYAASAAALGTTVAGGANTVLTSTGAGAPSWNTDMTVDNTNYKVTVNAAGISPTTDAFIVNASPATNAATSLMRLGTAEISGGNPSGTYIGVNQVSPMADFINYEVAGTSKFKVDDNGNVTANVYNGNGSGLTGVTATPTYAGLTPGGLMWANSATSVLSSAAGTTNQTLVSNGAAAPTWTADLTITGASHLVSIAGTAPTGDALDVPQAPHASATTSLVKLGATAIAGGNASGTYLGVNQAAATADFINYEIAGTSQFLVDKSGNATAASLTANTTSTTVVPLVVKSPTGTTVDLGDWYVNGVLQYSLNNTGNPVNNTDLVEKAYYNTTSANWGTNYVRKDGTTALTAAWNVGAEPISNISTLSVGTVTAPTGGVATFNGNVGIGTTAPTSILQVNGTPTAGNSTLQVNGVPTANTFSAVIASTTTTVGTDYNAISAVNTSATNNNMATIGFSDSVGGNNGAAIVGLFQDHPVNDGSLLFMTRSGGTSGEKMRIASTGNVGIGTTTPAAALDVAGNINSSFGYQIGGMTYLNGNGGTLGLFVGPSAGVVNTGNGNTFVGNSAGAANTSGNSNTFIGADAGNANVTGTLDTYIGSSAAINATGTSNTIIGGQAGSHAGFTGSYNIFLGTQTGYYATTATENILIGFQAGYVLSSGAGNILIGYGAGEGISSGGDSTMVGMESGQNVSAGGDTGDTFFGYYSGNNDTTGTDNTFLGHQAGQTVTSGSNNTFVGYGADGSTTTASSVAIGYNAKATASNAIQIGTGTNSTTGTIQLGSLTIVDPTNNLHGANMGLFVGSTIFTVGAGYAGAKTACNSYQTGSHMCTTQEMVISAQEANPSLASAGTVVVASGIPNGANGDCIGFTSNSFSTAVTWTGGAYPKPSSNSASCTGPLSIACCQ